MILSTGRKYVFVHAPKTGGTALALALENRAMKDDIMLGDTPKALKRRRRVQGIKTRGRLWKHATLADIDGLVPSLDGLFAFTLVRNPWDRMVSYYHWLRDQEFDHPAVALARQMDFVAFTCSMHTRSSMRASPARHYMTDAQGHERCDLYIRLEHFDDDAAPLWDHLGFALALPHANRSRRDADYRGYYTDAARAAVAEACAEDIERFGYSFD
ncbi:sulfotransferase family 2 domain-containing protein [Tateyamaria omphalii]|uniref:Type II secretory pathway, pullulanase PulA n=1 Tax=Tateyamaria omphalii TaxID=299262 RepID=A0A1P8MRZ2_9RHOB|nr:sulfotransferase family 2 domain-containing protein [Tateyamaria omphalii]APX10794.1 Type II secretory pathway, pullulanase PulA [Tateyamaria omphalii]